MFLRLLYQSFHRQRRRKLLAGVAILLGTAMATAVIAVGINIGDKINRELASYGANILLTPEDATLDVKVGGATLKPATAAAYIKESDLPRLKGIFWGHNILGYSPVLSSSVDVSGKSVQVLGTYFDHAVAFGKENLVTGVKITHPWWRVQGGWPAEDRNQVLVGYALAQKLDLKIGDTLATPVAPVSIVGILETGGVEDSQIVAPLRLVQEMNHLPNAADRVYVRALTKPEDAFARRDPGGMSPKDRDRWYCSPYANSIVFQIHEALPALRAEQIRQVAQNEGTVLSRISGLMLLITLMSLIAAALAVSSAMTTSILERRSEVGLMKSLGASAGSIAALFLAEASILAVFSGTIGFLLGAWLAHAIGMSIFRSPITATPLLIPVVLSLAVIITFAGSAVPIGRATKLDPVLVLRGNA
jgi:putative ABC transport system permease protein